MNIHDVISEYYKIHPERKITVRTGRGGMELISVAMEEAVGLYRIYLGRQVPRILRRLNFKIFKSTHYGKYYKLLDKNNGKMVHNTARTESKYS